MTWQILLARVRLPLLLLAVVLLVVGGRLGFANFPVRLVLFFAAYVVLMRAGTVRQEDTAVQAPVRGRWSAMNSPGTRVPSHGIQVYGQAYAIDLVHEPSDRHRPKFAWWPLTRRAAAFPAFGQPVFAATGGVVVRAHQRERDHWSRNSWPALVYVLVEGVLRELTGPSRVLGNHVIVDVGNGVYTAYAHLQRGSLRVAKGQRVKAGEHIADCGNSGNSTEPHLHFHLMDHPSVLVAAGLPVAFDHYETDGTPQTGMPANNQTFDVPPREAELQAPGSNRI